MAEYQYTVVFEPAEEGGYVVHVPALNGIVTQGDTFEEATKMAVDLISGYLTILKKDGLPIPIESAEVVLETPVVKKLAVAI